MEHQLENTFKWIEYVKKTIKLLKFRNQMEEYIMFLALK